MGVGRLYLLYVVRRRSSIFFQKTWSELGRQKPLQVPSKFFDHFPFFFGRGTRGQRRLVTGSHHHLSTSSTLVWVMADRRKRGAPLGAASSPRPKLRRKPSGKQDTLQKMKAVAAILMLLSVVTATVVQCVGPRRRSAVYEPKRLEWEAHAADLRRRRLFRRMYRMDEHSFDKLADLLRPCLERNAYFASEKKEDGG